MAGVLPEICEAGASAREQSNAAESSVIRIRTSEREFPVFIPSPFGRATVIPAKAGTH